MKSNTTINFKTIAVDFDGTLCYSKWPELGQPNQALIEYLQEWKRNGNKLILWTCRAAKLYQKLSNGAGNKTLNLMPSMATFRKS